MGSATSTAANPENTNGQILKQGFGNGAVRLSTTFKTVDTDNSGGIDKHEFFEAARAVGLGVSEDELTQVFQKYDADGSGTIDQEEFIRFFNDKQSSFVDEDQASVNALSADGLKSILPYLGPTEASRGFKKALLILKKNPAAAAAALSPTNPMQPLHVLLNIEAPLKPGGEGSGHSEKGRSEKAKEASQAAATGAAIPLIQAVLLCHPDGAKVRVGRSELVPDGRLPLHTALEKMWPLPVIQALVAAFPDGARTVDATKMKKGARVEPTLKTGRWARKLAEAHPCGDERVALLPMPKGKHGPFEWVTQEEIDAAPVSAKKGKKGKKTK